MGVDSHSSLCNTNLDENRAHTHHNNVTNTHYNGVFPNTQYGVYKSRNWSLGGMSLDVRGYFLEQSGVRRAPTGVPKEVTPVVVTHSKTGRVAATQGVSLSETMA